VHADNPLSKYETEDRDLLDFPTTTIDAVITNKELEGKTLGERGRNDLARGVFLSKLVRQEQELPFTPQTVIHRGDVLTLSGIRPRAESVAQSVGYVDYPTSATDMTSVGLAIVIGGLIGLLAVHFGNLEIGLSMSVGALIGGLVLGWLRSVNRFCEGSAAVGPCVGGRMFYCHDRAATRDIAGRPLRSQNPSRYIAWYMCWRCDFRARAGSDPGSREKQDSDARLWSDLRIRQRAASVLGHGDRAANVSLSCDGAAVSRLKTDPVFLTTNGEENSEKIRN
jgi:hypothetical protein